MQSFTLVLAAFDRNWRIKNQTRHADLKFDHPPIPLRVLLSRARTSLHRHKHVKTKLNFKWISMCWNTVALYTALLCAWRMQNICTHCSPSCICTIDNIYVISSNCLQWRKITRCMIMHNYAGCTFLEATLIFSMYSCMLGQHAAFTRI